MNSKNTNKGKPIYYQNTLHYIVHEFDDHIIISKNEDLIKAFSVRKKTVSLKDGAKRKFPFAPY